MSDCTPRFAAYSAVAPAIIVASGATLPCLASPTAVSRNARVAAAWTPLNRQNHAIFGLFMKAGRSATDDDRLT